jgi:hypothetical protein
MTPMALYADRAVLANDPVFLGRTRNAAMRYSMYQADAGDPLAMSFLGSPDTWTRQFALAISTEPEALSGEANDPAADTADGDTALQYAMENRVWPAFSAGLA